MALTTAAVAAATMKIEPAESPIQADSDNALISRSTRLVSESSTMTVRYSRRILGKLGFGTLFGSVVTDAMEEVNAPPTATSLRETVREAKLQRIRRQQMEAPFTLDFQGAEAMVRRTKAATSQARMIYVSARILSLSEVRSLFPSVR